MRKSRIVTNIRKGIGLITLLVLSYNVDAQQFIPVYLQYDNEFISQNFEVIDSSGWLQILPESRISDENFLDLYKRNFGMSDNDNFVLIRTTNDDYPFMPEDNKRTHYRYNQIYKGLKVEYAELFIHSKNGYIESLNGKLAEGLNLSETPALSEQEALQLAINHIGVNNIYSWQDTDYEDAYKEEQGNPQATTYPKGELLIAKKDVNQNYNKEAFALAWKYRIKSLNPDLELTIYIDAHTGSVLKQMNDVCEGNGILSYGYGSNAYIDTRYRGGFYDHHVLRSNDAGAPQIWTKKSNGGEYFGGYNCVIGGCTQNSFDVDDFWDAMRGGVTTPHWVATHTWNYFRDAFGRNSFDGNSTEVKIIGDAEIENAKWNPQEKILVFGKHNGNHVGTRDIVGHEFTHGVTEYTANLVYMNEPGALNESFSDIFGYEVERYINGGTHTNWSLGEDAQWILRRMNNPSNSRISSCHNQSQPAFYQGARWYFGTCDFGGVHINSGVQNYWFYLLTQGSVGALDGIFNNISVSGIGADKAKNIAYYDLDNYLGSNSNYNDSRLGSIFGSMNIYGSCSNENTQTINAWAAVGIGTPRLPLTMSGNNLVFYHSNINSIQLPLNYTASGGNASRYRWTYSGPWTYSILTTGTPWENVFSITNLNNYAATTTLKVSDRCTSVSKTIRFIDFDRIRVVISPNPVPEIMKVIIEYPDTELEDDIQVTISDLNGNIRFEQSYKTKEFSIDASSLNAGNYQLFVRYGELAKGVQFTKQ